MKDPRDGVCLRSQSDERLSFHTRVREIEVLGDRISGVQKKSKATLFGCFYILFVVRFMLIMVSEWAKQYLVYDIEKRPRELHLVSTVIARPSQFLRIVHSNAINNLGCITKSY